MSFSEYKHGILTCDNTLTGDAGIAINANFQTIGDLFDSVGDSSSLTLTGDDGIVATIDTSQGVYPDDGMGDVGTGLQNLVNISVNVPDALPANAALSFNGNQFIDHNGNMDVAGNLTTANGSIISIGSTNTYLEDGNLETSAINIDSNQSLYLAGIPITTIGGNTLDDGSGDMFIVGSVSINSQPVSGAQLTVGGSVSANSFGGNGANLTSLNASNITTGTLPDARLSSNVVTKSATNTATPAHSSATSVAGSGTGLYTNTQWSGATGSTSYTINDVITALKSAGLLKA